MKEILLASCNDFYKGCIQQLKNKLMQEFKILDEELEIRSSNNDLLYLIGGCENKEEIIFKTYCGAFVDGFESGFELGYDKYKENSDYYYKNNSDY